MPERDTTPIGAPNWIDLFTSDPDQSRAFYGELMGWTSTEPNMDYGGSINFTKGESLVAGGVIVPAMVLDEMGSMAVISHAGGAAIGMWQPGTHKGMGLLAEPGAHARLIAN